MKMIYLGVAINGFAECGFECGRYKTVNLNGKSVY